MALTWLATQESDTVSAGRRRRRALLIVAGATVAAVAAVVAALLVPADTPAPHPGRAVVSPDGRIQATVYTRHRPLSFTDVTEVTLRPVGRGDEVSLGCLVSEVPVAVTFDEDSTALTVDAGGELQRVRFDPRTLNPTEHLGPC